MSQTSLGATVGLTFQQIQKYERGSNRTGSSRLYEFSRVLNVPVSYFFEGLEDAARSKGRLVREYRAADNDNSAKRETLELVRAYYKIRNATVRNQIRLMIEAMARG